MFNVKEHLPGDFIKVSCEECNWTKIAPAVDIELYNFCPNCAENRTGLTITNHDKRANAVQTQPH